MGRGGGEGRGVAPCASRWTLRTTPPMMGTRVEYTGREKNCPSSVAEKRQVNRGSAVFTTFAKATVP